MKKTTISVVSEVDPDGLILPLHFAVHVAGCDTPVTLTYDQITEAIGEFNRQRIRRFGMIQKSRGHVSA